MTENELLASLRLLVRTEIDRASADYVHQVDNLKVALEGWKRRALDAERALEWYRDAATAAPVPRSGPIDSEGDSENGHG